MTVLTLLAAGAALLATAAFLAERRQTRRTLARLNAMLDAAVSGNFREDSFDETMVSAVETRMAQYLAAAETSGRNLAAEKDRLKELIGDISHQTRTPIANLLLYTQLLAERETAPENAALLASLTAQTEKLRFLIEALVKVSRLESGVLTIAPAPGALAPMLARAARQAEPAAAAKGIALTVEPTECRAVFDAKWSAEAVYNLLDNAVKYTPPGGRVTVSVLPYEMYCRIDVADTGPGVPEAERAKIFGRFYRAPAARNTEGVGIGLYLVRQIAAAQSGYVKVGGAPGGGSVFSLYLPRARAETGAAGKLS